MFRSWMSKRTWASASGFEFAKENKNYLKNQPNYPTGYIF